MPTGFPQPGAGGQSGEFPLCCTEGGNLDDAQHPSKSWKQRLEVMQTHPTEVTWQCPPEDVAVKKKKNTYPKNL